MRSVRLARRPEPVSAAVPIVCAEDLARVPESAAVARRLVVGAVAVWGLPELADTVALVVSELVSNAVRHASGAGLRVSVARVGERRVRVSVLDGDRTRPRVRRPGPGGERGRGLLIVAAEATSWGVDLLPGGKCVWAQCTADPADHPAAAPAAGRAAVSTPTTTDAGPGRGPGPDSNVHRSTR